MTAAKLQCSRLIYNQRFTPRGQTKQCHSKRAFISCGSRSCARSKPWASRLTRTNSRPRIASRRFWASTARKPLKQLENPRVAVKVAGRIISLRLQGKAGFAHLQQGGQRLQIYVKLDFVGEKGFALYKLLDLGDHIGVGGYLFRTRTGELTIHVEDITFLAKDFLPLPEKWHGLSDVELRYRQRYVDLIMNQEVREVFVKRSKVVQAIRRFLDARGYR